MRGSTGLNGRPDLSLDIGRDTDVRIEPLGNDRMESREGHNASPVTTGRARLAVGQNRPMVVIAKGRRPAAKGEPATDALNPPVV